MDTQKIAEIPSEEKTSHKSVLPATSCNMQEVEVLQRIASFSNSERLEYQNKKDSTLTSIDLLDKYSTKNLVSISSPPPPNPPPRKKLHSIENELNTENILTEIDEKLQTSKKFSLNKTKSIDIYTPHEQKVELTNEQLAEQLAKIVHQQNCTSVITSIFRVFLAGVNLVLLIFGFCLLVVGIWGAIDQRFDGITSGVLISTDPTFFCLILGFLIMVLSLQAMIGFWKGKAMILRVFTGIQRVEKCETNFSVFFDIFSLFQLSFPY